MAEITTAFYQGALAAGIVKTDRHIPEHGAVIGKEVPADRIHRTIRDA
jgi:hypothetical protein